MTRQPGSRSPAIALVAFAVSISLAGCSGSDENARATTESAAQPKEIRHDLVPLTHRFPAIGDPIQATWMSGTFGEPSDGRATAPGPSVYWIEAIIELQSATADVLRAEYSPTTTAARPDLDENLQPDVPAGPFLTSTALDTALSNNDWHSTAYLHSDSNTLVLKSVDD